MRTPRYAYCYASRTTDTSRASSGRGELYDQIRTVRRAFRGAACVCQWGRTERTPPKWIGGTIPTHFHLYPRSSEGSHKCSILGSHLVLGPFKWA